jgi:hypothetical protein
MHHLPETGFLRLRQIIGDAKADPPIPPIIPVKKISGGMASSPGASPSR